ncbi:MAG: hypothetical protein ACQEXJ_21095 [Myxococcota bacterium]
MAWLMPIIGDIAIGGGLVLLALALLTRAIERQNHQDREVDLGPVREELDSLRAQVANVRDVRELDRRVSDLQASVGQNAATYASKLKAAEEYAHKARGHLKRQLDGLTATLRDVHDRAVEVDAMIEVARRETALRRVEAHLANGEKSTRPTEQSTAAAHAAGPSSGVEVGP